MKENIFNLLNFGSPLEKTLFIVILLWSIFWKLYAVWYSARNNNKGWFIVLVLVNLFGILEIIYVFGVLKKSPKDVKNDLVKTYHKVLNKLS